jgi:rubredoxin
MPLVVAMNEIPPERVNKLGRTTPGSPGALSTTFFRAKPEEPDAPTAALNRYTPESRVSAAHFHQVDQFQVIMEGSGDFGRHPVKPYCVHFSRAYTPYGPLTADKQTGWGFIVMRTRFDPGAQRFPQCLDQLKQVPNRRPWQVTQAVSFPAPTNGVGVKEIPEIHDDQGLFTRTVAMAPNARMTGPDPSTGDGQYVVVVKGSLVHEGKEKPAPAVVFVKRDEPAFDIQAGAQGLEAILLGFPKVERKDEEKARERATSYKVWACALCAFVYDEETGLPAEGIAPGTRWADVPETWSCPDCSAKKADFDMVEI